MCGAQVLSSFFWPVKVGKMLEDTSLYASERYFKL
jgi:hypothetical protein